MNIFNSPRVIVRSCIFQNNTSTSYFTRKQFQGNGGGLSVGYNEKLARISFVDVQITDCEFINNNAVPPTNLSLSTTQALQKEVFSGRGGALCMPIKTTASVNVVVSNCSFVNNFATNFGGAFYQFVNEIIGNQTYMFKGNKFFNNRALRGAGAVNFGNFGNNNEYTSFNGTFYKCTFENNSATLAGGLHIFPSYFGLPNSFIRMELCNFYGNTASRYAGAIDIISYNYFGSRQHYEPFEFVNW